MVCARNECQVEFKPARAVQKYCSRSCAAKVNNLLYPKRKKIASGRTCDNCYSLLFGENKKYCSHKCQREYHSQRLVDNWIAGVDSGSSPSGILRGSLRKYLLVQSGYRCQSPTCAVPGGWSVPNPITGKPILTVDHIDGNWKNNSFDNLIVLCYNCHTLTPTFGSLNRGSKSGQKPNPESRARGS